MMLDVYRNPSHRAEVYISRIFICLSTLPHVIQRRIVQVSLVHLWEHRHMGSGVTIPGLFVPGRIGCMVVPW